MPGYTPGQVGAAGGGLGGYNSPAGKEGTGINIRDELVNRAAFKTVKLTFPKPSFIAVYQLNFPLSHSHFPCLAKFPSTLCKYTFFFSAEAKG